MRVTVERATDKPVEIISMAAGICYGKGDAASVSIRRVENCYANGHLSVFEHAEVSLRVEGISRACMAQLTRHRLVSFCVESQRYNRYDLTGDDWYVKPEAFDERPFDGFCYKDALHTCAENYMSALKAGIRPEDARYLLPEATKTNLVMTLNCRELYHFLDMRLAKSAQWEIRDLASCITKALREYDRDWAFLIDLWG